MARSIQILPKSLSSDPSHMYELSPEQIQFYEENGYLVIKKLIDLPALHSYSQRFQDLCNGKESANLVTVVKDYNLLNKNSKPETYIYKIQDILDDDVYSTYPSHPRLLKVVSQLIGEDLTVVNGMLINKPPGTNTHLPHQDLIYFPFRPAHQILASWTAIDSVTEENGCLFVVPGSHKPRELLEHVHQVNDGKPFFFSVANWQVVAPESKRVNLPMDPGDTVLMTSTLIHGSKPNLSKSYRKAITCHYANSHCELSFYLRETWLSMVRYVSQGFRGLGTRILYGVGLSSDPSHMYELSPEQIQFYEENGYLVIKKLIDLPALHSYSQRFQDLCNGKESANLVTVVKDYKLLNKNSKPETYIYKIQDILDDDVYSTYASHPRLLKVVSQLIGEDLTVVNGMLINKPPGTNTHLPHQDLIYFPFRPAHQILASWTAIDPVTEENGCLFVVPGSHKPRELLEHVHQVNDGKPFFFSVANWQVVAPESKRVNLPMDPGDTVLMTSTLIHGSKPNLSKSYRKAITCHYANSHCEYIDPTGTRHEQVAHIVEKELERQNCHFIYVDLMKFKMKTIKGVKCNL